MYYGVQISLRNVTNRPVSRLHDTETSHMSQFHYRPKRTRIQTVPNYQTYTSVLFCLP
jgi:hypothetical protein